MQSGRLIAMKNETETATKMIQQLFDTANNVSDKEDDINHPSRYNNGQYECIKVMEAIFGIEAVKWFCICNAFKYIWRHTLKGGSKDIEKARFYIDYYIELNKRIKNE